MTDGVLSKQDTSELNNNAKPENSKHFSQLNPSIQTELQRILDSEIGPTCAYDSSKISGWVDNLTASK